MTARRDTPRASRELRPLLIARDTTRRNCAGCGNSCTTIRARTPPPDAATGTRSGDSPVHSRQWSDDSRGSRCGCGNWRSSWSSRPPERRVGRRSSPRVMPGPDAQRARSIVGPTRARRWRAEASHLHDIDNRTPSRDRLRNSPSMCCAPPRHVRRVQTTADPRATVALQTRPHRRVSV
jgi:hypothetical protein